MTTETARLEIKNLMRRFGSRTVVDDVSLRILPGSGHLFAGTFGLWEIDHIADDRGNRDARILARFGSMVGWCVTGPRPQRLKTAQSA